MSLEKTQCPNCKIELARIPDAEGFFLSGYQEKDGTKVSYDLPLTLMICKQCHLMLFYAIAYSKNVKDIFTE